MWKKTVLSSREKRKSLLSSKYHFCPLNVTSVLLFFHISSLGHFSPWKSQFCHLKSQFCPLKAKIFLAHNFGRHLYSTTSYVPVTQNTTSKLQWLIPDYACHSIWNIIQFLITRNMRYVNDTDFIKHLLVQLYHLTKYMFMSFGGYEIVIFTSISILLVWNRVQKVSITFFIHIQHRYNLPVLHFK